MAENKVPGASPVEVAVVGLGLMGAPIARHLLAAGHRVTGFDVNSERMAAATAAGVSAAASAAEAAATAGVVLTSLPSEDALTSTVKGLVSAPGCHQRDLAMVELSTLSVQSKRAARDALAAVGIGMLDCPVSGTGAQAITRDIVLYASGEQVLYQACVELFSAFCRDAYYVGVFGQGMKMKLVANHLVAILNVAAAEAVNLAELSGLDPAQMLEVVGAGAAGFRLLDLRGPMMAQGRYEPATMKLEVWQKDMALIEAFAAGLKASTPLFSATKPLYAGAIERGWGGQDTAAVRELLRAADQS
jgi:putative dehydrogenase